MKIIGVTGGIGSGKSIVCELFKLLDVPVFDSDTEAKKLYQNKLIIDDIVANFGNDILYDSKIDFKKLSLLVFNNPEKLYVLNQIVHPKLQEHFDRWCLQFTTLPYIIKEAAILIESGSYKQCNEIILVTAPLEMRINRVIKRNGFTHDEVIARVNKQLSDADKEPYVQHRIKNDELQLLIPQVLELHQKFSA